MRAEKEGERQVSLLSSHIETTDGRTKEEVHDDGCRRTYLVRRKEEEDLLGVRYLESVVARFDHFSSSSAAQFPAGIFPENVRGRRGRKGGGGRRRGGENGGGATSGDSGKKEPEAGGSNTHTYTRRRHGLILRGTEKKAPFSSRSHTLCAYVRLKHSNIPSNIAVVCESETHQL